MRGNSTMSRCKSTKMKIEGKRLNSLGKWKRKDRKRLNTKITKGCNNLETMRKTPFWNENSSLRWSTKWKQRKWRTTILELEPLFKSKNSRNRCRTGKMRKRIFMFKSNIKKSKRVLWNSWRTRNEVWVIWRKKKWTLSISCNKHSRRRWLSFNHYRTQSMPTLSTKNKNLDKSSFRTFKYGKITKGHLQYTTRCWRILKVI